MNKRLLFGTLLSLCLVLAFASPALAAKKLTLGSVTGQGTVTFDGKIAVQGTQISVGNNATVNLVATPATGWEFKE